MLYVLRTFREPNSDKCQSILAIWTIGIFDSVIEEKVNNESERNPRRGFSDQFREMNYGVFEIKRLEMDAQQKAQFLELLSTSLTDNTMEWLEWKYMTNPLSRGTPTVFGAIHKESGKLAGMRPCMICKVVFGDKVIKAAQPCDTVVHPEFRRRGIFRDMNKVAIEEMTKDGYDLFFNFPNRNSQPGNLKMGWRNVMVFDESLAFDDFPKVVKNMTGTRMLSSFECYANSAAGVH